MQRDPLLVARALAERLFLAETAVDEAFRAAAELAAFLPQARTEARVSAELGQDAFEMVALTMQVLGDARRNLVDVHKALAETQGKVGLRERNFGGFVDKPKAAQTLEVVRARIA